MQAPLGSANSLERELGGGGMSRVFLAREVRLGRDVVVTRVGLVGEPPHCACQVDLRAQVGTTNARGQSV